MRLVGVALLRYCPVNYLTLYRTIVDNSGTCGQSTPAHSFVRVLITRQVVEITNVYSRIACSITAEALNIRCTHVYC